MIGYYVGIFIDLVSNLDKFWSALLLIFAKIISAVLFFPGTPLTLLSGVILGTFWGSIVAVVGNTIGAVFAFLLARYLFRNFVQKNVVKKYPKIQEYEEKLFSRGFYTIIFLRLVPIFPFNALNFILGVTKVQFNDYFFGTFLGIIPGTIAFVYLGKSFAMFSWLNIFLAIVGIIGLSYISKVWKI